MSVVIKNITSQKLENKIEVPPKEILNILPSPIKEIVLNAWSTCHGIEEIRLRKNKPLIIRFAKGEAFFDKNGSSSRDINGAFVVTPHLIESILRIISKNSLYALETELRNGFITVLGGHRIGFAGEIVLDNKSVKTQKNIASLNVRVARAVKDCAQKVLPYIIDPYNDRVLHTMIVSPPRCGKTTLLRDIIRNLSYGITKPPLTPKHIGLVDERSEIAGCYLGVPQLDVGPRTDVLDRSPKHQGMIMLVRSMGPEIIATDELGGEMDIEAVQQVVNAGVKLLTTVHGDDFEQLYTRPYLRQLIDMNIFERFVFLNKYGTGAWIKCILNGKGKSIAI